MADTANITVNVATGNAITSNLETGAAITSNVSENTSVTANVITGGKGEGVPTGGTTGQILAKSSSTNYDTEWQDIVPWDIDTDSNNGVTRVRSSTNNYLANAGFLFWNSGTTVAPDGWTLQGDATIARSSTASIDSYSAQITFGTANTGELYQSVNVSNLVDYTYSVYVQRTSGSGSARLVAQDASSPYTEYATVNLSTESGWQLASLTVKPTNTGQMRFAIKSGNTTASTWLVDECMFQESKAVATTFQYGMVDDSTAQNIYGNKSFGYTYHYTSDILSLYTDYIGGKTDANVSFDLNGDFLGTLKVNSVPVVTASSWQTWVPTFAGFSSDPTGGIYRYRTIGDYIEIEIIQPNDGTSNASNFTISLPVASANIADSEWVGWANTRNNTAFVNNTSLALVPLNSSTLTLWISPNRSTGWGTSGGKRCAYLKMSYRWQ